MRRRLYQPGRWGGGSFYYNASDTTSADNGATIIVASNGNRFHRIWDRARFNVLWAGADLTGTNSSDGAFATSFSVSSAIYAPKGRYKLNNALTYNVPFGDNGFTFFGDGSEQTVLYFANNSGLTVNYGSGTSVIANSVLIEDLTLTAGVASGGAAVTLSYATNEIPQGGSCLSNLRIRGDDGVGSFHWTDGILINGVSNVNITGCYITGNTSFATSGGNGIVLQGNPVGSIVYNIASCTLYYLAKAITYGQYIQGVTVTSTNITNALVGIVAYPNEGSTATPLDQMTVISCQFATVRQNTYLQSYVGNVQIVGNLFSLQESANNINVIEGDFQNFAISGNCILGVTGANTNGIVIDTGVSGMITGNVLGNLSGGILLSSSTSAINVQWNLYNGVGTHYVNSGTSNQVGGGSA